jgi:hypothetical protein
MTFHEYFQTSFSYWGTNCPPVEMTAADGKLRKIKAANRESLLRLIHSVSSPKVPASGMCGREDARQRDTTPKITMHVTPTLTPAAMRRWARMSDAGKEAILNHIWCSACDGTGIRDARGDLHPSGDIILTGYCPACGGKVSRVIETGDTMGPADEYP